jgi:hypothetical protein
MCAGETCTANMPLIVGRFVRLHQALCFSGLAVLADMKSVQLY